MKLETWLKECTSKLKANNISSARLDALILLEDALDKDRAWLLAHPEFEIDLQVVKKLSTRIKRRANHEPLAYIRGKSEFYGREFKVSAATLQPRTETETMITLLKNSASKTRSWKIADVGTGSGCIAITAALEIPTSQVYAVELNQDALSIAKQNAAKLNVDINFLEGNLLEPLANENIDIILANLPYVPDSHTINEAAMHEPKMAIFGGPDGLDIYMQMFTQIERLGKLPDFILTESLPFQHQQLANVAHQASYLLKDTQDFIQLFQLKN